MKNKSLIIILLIAIALGVTGCGKTEEKSSSIKFKKEYESLNGKTNEMGKKHRTVTISADNPFIKVNPNKIIDKIENNETFYLYVGDSLCPWCRSVLEKFIEVSKNKNIKKVYYIDIWDEDGKEILRDKYELQDGKAVKTSDGTKAYKKLLKYFDSVLSDYDLTDSGGNKVSTGEKRIYAPNFFYVEKGKIKKMVEGISEKQKDSREKLTEEILKDEEKIFEEFFS